MPFFLLIYDFLPENLKLNYFKIFSLCSSSFSISLNNLLTLKFKLLARHYNKKKYKKEFFFPFYSFFYFLELTG